MHKTLIAITLTIIILALYRHTSISQTIANILATVLLWKGLWNIITFIDIQLKTDDRPLVSGALSIGSGVLLSYIFS